MAKCVAVMELAIPVSAQDIWAQWIDPQKLSNWFWPIYPDTVYEINAQAGGSFRFSSNKTGVGAYGEVLEFIPYQLMRLSWNWVDEFNNDLEEVTIHFSDGLIRLEHIAETFDSCTLYQASWTDTLLRLKAVLTQ
ncbi:MAG: SRPBCC domain-containing protein [Clostridiales bacterium]|nr:SRPBCC domain-containing protein [Clostridiales bacterium]